MSILRAILLISRRYRGNMQRLLLFSYMRTLTGRIFPHRRRQGFFTKKFLGFKISYYSELAYDILLNEVFFSNVYRFDSLTDTPMIIDCGANIGMAVLFFKQLYPSCRLLAFEPDPNAFKALNRNIEQNGLTGVKTFNVAVSDRAGEIEFYTNADNPADLGASIIPQEALGGHTIVKTAKLSDFVTEKINMLKLDIEGTEHEVLNELKQADKLRFIDNIVMEYHHHMGEPKDRLGSFLSTLESQGFGYQIESVSAIPFKKDQFRSLNIYAYRL